MQDWDWTTWLFVGGGALVVLIIVLVTIVDSAVLSNEEAAVLAPDVASQVSPAGSIVPAKGEPLDEVKVYVDRTLSMRPFTAPSRSTYFDLLMEMDGLMAGNIQFFGFGFPSENQQQVTRPVDPILLEEAAQYGFVNNDYGQIFAGLDRSSTHLVVSDGVQSDVEEGDRFRQIVVSIGDWIEDGGVFALLAYRAPYRGTYYHESPTKGRVEYNCDNRPFYAFTFLPSAKAKQDLLEILESGQVAPEYVLTIGQASADVSIQEYQPPPDPSTSRGPLSLASFAAHGDASPSIRSVFSGRPTQEESTPLHVEVQFDSTGPAGGRTPWPSLSEQQMDRVARSFESSFRHWRIDTLSVERETTTLTPTSGPSILDVVSKSASKLMRASLSATFQHAPHAPRERIASLLTIGLSSAGANTVVPDRFSTRRDDRPSACSQTLNLQRTMGAILREHYVVGRTLLVTEWR